MDIEHTDNISPPTEAKMLAIMGTEENRQYELPAPASGSGLLPSQPHEPVRGEYEGEKPRVVGHACAD